MVMGLASLSTIPDYVSNADWNGLFIMLAIFAVILLLVLHHFKQYLDCQEARKIATHLNGIASQLVDFKDLEKQIPVDSVIRKLQAHITRGYIQNIQMDLERHVVVLLTRSRLVVEDLYVEVKCPRCGVPQLMVRGRLGECEYCGSTVFGQDGMQKDEVKV